MWSAAASSRAPPAAPGPPTPAQPQGKIALDRDGNLYIADTQNARVRMVKR